MTDAERELIEVAVRGDDISRAVDTVRLERITPEIRAAHRAARTMQNKASAAFRELGLPYELRQMLDTEMEMEMEMEMEAK